MRSYTAAMSACTRGGEWKIALELWGRMNARGVPADGPAYGAVVSACAEGGQVVRARKLLDAYRKDGRVHRRADTRVYDAALRACATAGEWSTAKTMLGEMKRVWKVRPTVYTYNAALSAASAARQWAAPARWGC